MKDTDGFYDITLKKEHSHETIRVERITRNGETNWYLPNYFNINWEDVINQAVNIRKAE